MPTNEYLSELFNPELPISSSKLLSLSGLSDTEAVVFRGYWEGGTLARRKGLIDLLTAIAEDNAEVDFNPVFRVALDDAEPEVRAKSIDSLWECQERWFLNRLVTTSEGDPVAEVRAAAASALGKFVLLGVFEELRPPLLERVEGVLKRIIAKEDEAVAVRRRAIEALGPSADPSVNDIIRKAYHSDVSQLKLSAVHAMGQHCDEGWLPVLLTELKNSDPAMRFAAARACGELEDDRAVPGLIELTQESDSQVQEAAIVALGHIGGEEAQRALRRCLAKPDPRIREAARAALEEIALGEDPLAFH